MANVEQICSVCLDLGGISAPCFACGLAARDGKTQNNPMMRPAMPLPAVDGGTILDEMAATFRERNAMYRDGYHRFGAIMHILHGPDSLHPMAEFGATPEAQSLFRLYGDAVAKLVRFADSGLTHVDSIHDMGVYAALVEALIRNKK
jgi:hypothetical protein